MTDQPQSTGIAIVEERETFSFWEVECAIADAVRRERERCARIARSRIDGGLYDMYRIGNICAESIAQEIEREE